MLPVRSLRELVLTLLCRSRCVPVPYLMLTPSLRSVNACDRPTKFEELKVDFADQVRARQALTRTRLTLPAKRQRSAQRSPCFSEERLDHL